MKRINFLTLIFTFLLMLLTISVADAQEQLPPDSPNPKQTVRPFKIFEELGLSPEQIQQIKGINKRRKPITQAAQQRWREANRSLDAAVYADSTTDDEIKMRLKEAQTAQSELLKERTTTEYLIRKVLTPDQLIKFRQLREELMEKMNELKNRNNPNNPNVQQQTPINRLQQRRFHRQQQTTN